MHYQQTYANYIYAMVFSAGLKSLQVDEVNRNYRKTQFVASKLIYSLYSARVLRAGHTADIYKIYMYM